MTSLRLGLRVVMLISLLVLVMPADVARAQVGVLDDIPRLVAAGRGVAKSAVLSGRPARAAERAARKMSLTGAAAAAFEKTPIVPGRKRMYLGHEGQVSTFILDDAAIPAGAPLDEALQRQLARLGLNAPNGPGIDLFVEADVAASPAFRQASMPEGVQIYLANLDGPSWRARRFDAADGPTYHVRITDTLYARLDNGTGNIVDLSPLKKLPFRRGDIRIISFFDRGADLDTFEAISATAIQNGAPLHHVRDADLSLAFKNARGKIVAAVGHVEGDQFVLRRSDGQPDLKFDVAEVQRLALEHDAALVLLGCETAKFDTGFPFVAHSRDVAAQLDEALKSESHVDFFSALGSPDVPLVIEESTIDQAHLVVTARLRREQDDAARMTRASRSATITSARFSTRLPEAGLLPTSSAS